MTIKSLQSTSLTNNVFYRSMLAGNDAYFPEFESDDFLEEVVLTSNTTSITFSGLGTYATAGYKHLEIRIIGRSASTGAGSDATRIRVNGDTGSNYSWHILRADGGAVQGNATGVNQTSITPSAGTWPRTSHANQYGAAIISVLDFNNPYKNKTLRILQGAAADYTAFTQISLGSGVLRNTAAITSLQISEGSTVGFGSGTRMSLYGSKG
jgi:hypothetical protein